MIPRVLTIAGSDSGGGAGIQADLKTFHNLRVFGASAITALTAQNTLGVQGIFELPPEFVALQIRSVLSDIGTDAVKVGMLSNEGIIRAVASVLSEFKDSHDREGFPIVLDPVMVSKSGARLLREEAIEALKEELIPLATIITPNLDEAGVLVSGKVQDEEEMRGAARELWTMGAKNVLIKGGHLKRFSHDHNGESTGQNVRPDRQKEAIDILFDGREFTTYRSAFIDTPHTHGTGCTLSSAIGSHLAHGKSVKEAIRLAKDYITLAIRKAYPIGHGVSPLDHLAFRAESPEQK